MKEYGDYLAYFVKAASGQPCEMSTGPNDRVALARAIGVADGLDARGVAKDSTATASHRTIRAMWDLEEEIMLRMETKGP
jgi:hypothetical protein